MLLNVALLHVADACWILLALLRTNAEQLLTQWDSNLTLQCSLHCWWSINMILSYIRHCLTWVLTKYLTNLLYQSLHILYISPVGFLAVLSCPQFPSSKIPKVHNVLSLLPLNEFHALWCPVSKNLITILQTTVSYPGAHTSPGSCCTFGSLDEVPLTNKSSHCW